MITTMNRIHMQLMSRGGSHQTPKSPITIIGTKVKELKVRTMVITTERVNMNEMESTIATTTSTGITMVKGMNGVVHMFHLKIGKLHLGMVEVVWCGLRICCRRC